MMLAADEKDSIALKQAIRSHAVEAIGRSAARGDEIDWERLGIPEPPVWKLLRRK